MGQIVYEILSGFPDFTVHIEPNDAPDNIHSSIGEYSFTDLPGGEYSLLCTDGKGCQELFEGILVPIITTTTTTTLAPPIADLSVSSPNGDATTQQLQYTVTISRVWPVDVVFQVDHPNSNFTGVASNYITVLAGNLTGSGTYTYNRQTTNQGTNNYFNTTNFPSTFTKGISIVSYVITALVPATTTTTTLPPTTTTTTTGSGTTTTTTTDNLPTTTTTTTIPPTTTTTTTIPPVYYTVNDIYLSDSGDRGKNTWGEIKTWSSTSILWTANGVQLTNLYPSLFFTEFNTYEEPILNGDTIRVLAKQGARDITHVSFNPEYGSKFYYLLSDNLYTSTDISTIMANATLLESYDDVVIEGVHYYEASFTAPDVETKHLYLIYDFRVIPPTTTTTTTILPVTTTTSTTSNLVVGSNYQGGKIAYIFKEGDSCWVEGEFHGIISALTDVGDTGFWPWSEGISLVPNGTSRYICMGLPNTINIVDYLGEGAYAASVCISLEKDGYSDWLLPSFFELQQLYDNKAILGGFSGDEYWSSSTYNVTFPTVGRAYLINFSTGAWITRSFSYNRKVRPVRYF